MLDTFSSLELSIDLRSGSSCSMLLARDVPTSKNGVAVLRGLVAYQQQRRDREVTSLANPAWKGRHPSQGFARG